MPGGLRLSYAVLGAFMKYPKGALPKRPTEHIAHKKFGFFQHEAADFVQVAMELGLSTLPAGGPVSYARHPLTYLVEAADDICYTIIDFEDGINLGLIPEDYALEYLINLVKGGIDTKKYNALSYKEDRLSYLRALAINTLIQDVVRVFMDNEEAILDGTFSSALLDKSKYAAQVEDIIKLSVEKVYRSSEVIEKEIAGYRIIADIMDVYLDALVAKKKDRASNYHKLVMATLPGHYADTKGSLYGSLLKACCYVASLSDRSAVHIHNKIKGNHL